MPSTPQTPPTSLSTAAAAVGADPDLPNLSSHLYNKMQLPADRPDLFMRMMRGEINEIIEQALEEAELGRILAEEGTMRDKAEHIYNIILGRTPAEQQQRKEYLMSLLAKGPQEFNDSIYSPCYTARALPPGTTKLVIKKLENNLAHIKKEMRELNKMMKELGQKLDNHRDKLNGFQQSQAKDISKY